jgi:serine/threonine protein kinase
MAAPARDSRSGELLNDVYELHEVLDSDGIHDTYRATDRRHARVVKVKLLRPEFALQSNVVQRFLRAPRTLTGLRHPNVSQVLAVESDETGIPFVVEEHVEGESLARTIECFPDGMPLAIALSLISKVVEAVTAAHELGVVHGRLDRDHVLLAKLAGTSVPKVVRFGSVDAGRARAASEPQRVAPELRDGKAVPDARSDVWALGALLYEALSGEPPVVSGHQPLTERAPDVPAELSQIVDRCLSPRPADRPARASALRDVLDATRARARPAQARGAPAHLRGQPTSLPAAARPVGRNSARAREISPPVLATTTADPLAATAPGDMAFSATMIARSPPASATSQVMHFPTADAATIADADEPALEISVDEEDGAAHDADEDGDEPEITLEPAAASLAPRRGARADEPAQEFRTLGDVAAAFGPIEGADRVGQADAPRVARAPNDDAEPASRAKTKNKYGKARLRAEHEDKPSERHKPAPLLSPKQLKQGNAPEKRTLSAAQMRLLRERTQQSERRRGRAVLALLFFLFVVFLVFAIPVLIDPTRTKARELLGERAQLAVGAFALLSVIALVRTWALQIQASPTLLRPVTITLKVVTALVCVLASTFFLPRGALGPAEVGARAALPWAGSAFYLFLAMYGLAMGLREASGRALYGVALALLHAGAFFGSYRVLATTVLVKKDRGSLMATGGGRANGRDSTDVAGIADYVAGDLKHDAGAAEEMVERNEVGASEADDLRAIDQLEDSRKRKSSQFNDLGKKMDEVIH